MNRDDSYEYHYPELHSETDHWIISRLNKVIRSATENLNKYELAIAGNEIMDFVWNDFCSMYIEFTKSALNSDDIALKHQTLDTLIYVLEAILKLLHPFIPFVTEEIYQNIHDRKHSIMKETWPKNREDADDDKAEAIDKVIEIIRKTREIRTENDIKPSKELHILLEGMEPDASLRSILARMTKLDIIEKTDQETIVRPTTFGNILYLMDEIVDRKAELEKIEKELERLEKEIARSEGMLKNERFLAKAPAEKVEEERNKLMNYQSSYDTLKEKKKELDQ